MCLLAEGQKRSEAKKIRETNSQTRQNLHETLSTHYTTIGAADSFLPLLYLYTKNLNKTVYKKSSIFIDSVNCSFVI